MEALKTYVIRNFEPLFVLATLIVTVVIYYVLPYKIGFLNFYFLPIILGGYYLGRRKAVMAAVFIALLIGTYAIVSPESFLETTSDTDIFLTLSTWGGFLVLAGAVVGKLQERIAKLDYPWTVRIGIGSGSMITGLIGSKRQTFTAIGDVVNVAARLEKACAPGRVLIDRHTYDGVRDFIEARKKRDLPAKDSVNVEKEQQLEALHGKLTGVAAQDADLFYQIGRIHLELKEPSEALHYFERALDLDPDNKDFKVAYAEAGLKMREYEKLSVKGKRQRVEAFEVIGLKDPLENRDKIPLRFYQDYGHLVNLIQIPADLIMPVEALDGCVGHSKVVAVIAYAIANCLNLPDKEKIDILHAGFMADIGKEIIPHHLLNRMGSLTPSEFEMVKMHTSEATRILRKMGYENETLLKIILHSHENFNGSGYPNGLKGEDIPLGSRIVAVADAYDALTSRRSYRDPWDRHAALHEIRQGVGQGIYDPKVVDALLSLLG